MNNISKIHLNVFLLVVILNGQAIAQDSSSALNDSWTKLKTQLRHRTDVAVNLADVLGKSGKADTVLIRKIKSAVADIRGIVDTAQKPDSILIQALYQKNSNLISAMARTLVLFEGDIIHSQEAFRDLQTQLQGAENRIAVAKRYYNQLCIQYHRKDLIYGKGQEGEPAPVSF